MGRKVTQKRQRQLTKVTSEILDLGMRGRMESGSECSYKGISGFKSQGVGYEARRSRADSTGNCEGVLIRPVAEKFENRPLGPTSSALKPTCVGHLGWTRAHGVISQMTPWS